MMLLQLDRVEAAVEEFACVLRDEPRDADALGMLAICHARLGRGDADDLARRAIEAAPEAAFPYYAYAFVLVQFQPPPRFLLGDPSGQRRRRLKRARKIVQEAIRVDPVWVDAFELLADIQFGLERFADSLKAAENGLSLDPQHLGCRNLRAQALLRLGRTSDADIATLQTLAVDPEHGSTHLTRGWTLLHTGDAAGALEHFTNALRLEPDDAQARIGFIESLKARNVIYRQLLRAFLAMQRWAQPIGVVLLLGMIIVFATDPLRRQGGKMSVPWWMASGGIVFVALVMIYPLFNLLIMLDPIGRSALTWTERFVAVFAAGLLIWMSGLVVMHWYPPPANLFVRNCGTFAPVPAAALALADPRRLGRYLWGALTLLFATLAVLLTFSEGDTLQGARLIAFVVLMAGGLAALVYGAIAEQKHRKRGV